MSGTDDRMLSLALGPDHPRSQQEPLNINAFLLIKKQLRYCPTCGWRLYDDENNSAILVCINHKSVYIIAQTTDGYRVEVKLATED